MTDVPLRDYVDRLFEEQDKHVARALAALMESRREEETDRSEVLAWIAIVISVLNSLLLAVVMLHK